MLKTAAALWTLVALASPCQAAGSASTPLFYSEPTFATGQEPYNLAIGDLNQDGKADLVTANQGGGGISVLLGDGAGSFPTHADYAIGPYASFVAIGDVNGDGRQDLIVTSGFYPNGTVSLLLGNGDGTFQPKADYPARAPSTGPSSLPTFLALGDLNRDGRQDVVTGFFTGVSVRLGQGDGTLGAATDLESPDALTLAVIDVNGDSNPDIVTAGDHVISVFRGNGDGSFQPRTDDPRPAPRIGPRPATRLLGASRIPAWKRSATSPDQWGNEYFLATGDLNGDGTPDLALASGVGSGSVSVLLGSPDGSFHTQVSYPVLDFVSAIAIGDVSGDGMPDIVTSNDLTGSVSIFLGNGTGAFPTRVDHGADGLPLSVGIRDVDGDGKPDLVTCNSPNSISVIRGNGDGTFQGRPVYPIVRGSSQIDLGDLDGDGRLDAVSLNWDYYNVFVLFGNGDGTLQQRIELPAFIEPKTQAVGDLNGDGRADLVLGDDNAGVVSVYLSHADRTFSARADYPIPNSIYSIVSLAIGDLNRDGRADIAATAGGVLSVLLGNGDGTFQPSRNTADLQLSWIALADLNGDLIPDLVSTRSGFQVSIFLGRGDGTFGTPTDYAAGTGAFLPYVADLNHDGHLDLLVSRFVFNSLPGVTVLLGNADGTFRSPAEQAGGCGSRVALADFDGDGNLDLAGAGTPGLTSVYLGNGDGTFGAPTDYATGRAGGLIRAGDLDRDGKPDLVQAGLTLSVLRNIGSGRAPLSAALELAPASVNLANHAPYLSAYIEPSGFSATDIDRASIRLAGSVPAVPKFAVLSDHNGNGLPDLLVKFRRSEIDPHLVPGLNHLELTGTLATGEAFHASFDLRCQAPDKGPKGVTVAPNPVNPRGTLSFDLDRGGPVRVRMFDRGGRLVRTLLDADLLPGPHRVVFDGTGAQGKRVASGIYYYRIETPEGPFTGRLAVVK